MNCDKCGLHSTCKSPHMKPDGPEDARVLVIGEAPGEQEDELGRPFVGRSGKLLRSALRELGYPMDDVRFTNVVLCRPPDNKISKRAINYCKKHLDDDLNSDTLELVLLLGNVPLGAVLGETGIMGWNGVVIERDGLVYVPVYHPAFVLRDQSRMRGWLDALDGALDVLDSGVGDSEYAWEYIYPETVADVRAMCDELMKSPVIAFDTETATLDPWQTGAHIVACSFANEYKAWAVAINHRERSLRLSKALNYMADVLRNHPNIVGHNIAFDLLHVKVCWGVDFQPAGDSMLASHLIDSRRGIHGLKRLAGIYLGMYDYDSELSEYISKHPEADPRKGGSYAKIPLDVLLPYAAKDAAASYAVHEIMLEKMTEAQRHLYHELLMPASSALMRMKYNGVAVDDYIVNRYMAIYGNIRADLYDDIISDKMVAKYVADKQREIDDEFDRKKLAGHRVSKRKVFTFNPNSHVQVGDVLYGKQYYNLPVTITTDTGRPSTSRDALKDIDLPLVRHLIYYKMLGKMLSTYIEPLATGRHISNDGRIHADFLLHGTETGRLASRNPNMQNIPTPEKEPGTVLETLPIKNMYTHTWDGGCLMSVDYSGMELRVFASLANCKPMLDIHRSGADFHSMVASMMTGLPVDKITKPVRYIYKWTNWTLLYGGDAHTLHKLYGIPMKDAEAAVRTYYEQFPEVLEYKNDCVRFARERGYIETPFGRRRWLNMNSHNDGTRRKAEREAVNTPVQSAASDITLAALTILDMFLREDGCKTMIVNTVHDSIVLDVYPGELDYVAELCVDIMENIVHYAGIYMPHIDFSWLKAPLRADVDVGSHYGALEKYELKEDATDER